MRVGLLGEKLSHSLSPLIHNHIYKNLGLELDYELFEVDKMNIHNFQNYMLENNVNAVNITIPYKKTFINSLDFISENAKKIGSINLMYQKNKKFYGENTDYYGFRYTLEKNNIEVKNKRIYILGRGGSALAVNTVLQDLGAKDINFLFRKDKESPIIFDENLSGDILINTTPIGMYPNIDDCLVDKNLLSNFKVAIDLIYNPFETKFLKLAKKNNLQAINGLEMLITQAIKTDEILFDLFLNTELRSKIEQELKEKIYKFFDMKGK